MFCPSCGREISDRAAFCPYCGVGVGAPPAEIAPLAPPQPRRRSRAGCWFAAIGIVIAILAILFGLWWFLGRRILTNYFLAEFSPSLVESLDFSPLRGATVSYSIEENELNRRMQSTLPADTGPVERIRVELVRGGVRLHIRAYGLDSTLEAEIGAWRGELQISRVGAGGLLLWVLEPGIIAAEIEQAVNEELKRNGIYLHELEISPLEVSINVAPTR